MRLGSLLTMIFMGACDVPAQIVERHRDPTSHERYAQGLESAGVEATAMARAWLEASERALLSPLAASLPLREEGFVEASEPRALGFAFDVERGQRVSVQLEFVSGQARVPDFQPRVFIELYRQPSDSTARPFLVHEMHADSTGFDFRPTRSGTHIVRVTPELLVGGRYSLDVRVLPSLAFPVEGRGPSAVLSRWGASRDGGRRSHRGIDIFAPRGTPTLAGASGRVSRVDTTEVGGRVVWLREDGTNHSLYYAHLNAPAVEEGQRVEIGDTVGFVGNTGNARTTPPHLHFGIYRRREGALDPFPFVEPQDSVAPAPAQDLPPLGSWRSTWGPAVRLRSAASTRAIAVRDLDREVPLRVLAHSGRWVRVMLPNGQEGYVIGNALGPEETVVHSQVVRPGTELRSGPRADAPVRRISETEESLTVLGVFAGFGLVLENGQASWLELDMDRAQ